MTKYERLLAKYDSELNIEERPMVNEGLYCDGAIWINSKNNNKKRAAILAEEIGHHKTSYGNILNLSDKNSAKQERKARIWAVKELLPLVHIQQAINSGYTKIYDIADYLETDEEFLAFALRHYGLLDDR